MPIQRCVFKKTNLLIVALLLALSVCVAAQVTTADVVGRVTDSSGAVLPGVTVVIENLGTGVSRSAVSSDTGDYVFNLLAAGRYSVRFGITGFQDIHRCQHRIGSGRSRSHRCTDDGGRRERSGKVRGQGRLLAARRYT